MFYMVAPIFISLSSLISEVKTVTFSCPVREFCIKQISSFVTILDGEHRIAIILSSTFRIVVVFVFHTLLKKTHFLEPSTMINR